MEDNLGNTLRNARIAQGLTVDDAVYLGKIPRAVVEALETGNFGFFSSPLYARSFLQQYGEYVGADVEQWLDDLEPTSMIDAQSIQSIVDMYEPVTTSNTTAKKEKTKHTSGSGTWSVLWMLVITVILIWIGMKVFSSFENKLAEDEATKTQTTEKVTNITRISNDSEAADTETEEDVSTEELTTDTVSEPPRRAIIVPE